MIDRYALPELRELFGERRRLQLWLRIELLAAEALHEAGIIPTEDWERLRSALADEEVDPERAREIERESQHDVIAFLRSVTERLGPEGRWLHYGLTSSDVLDTATAVTLRTRPPSWPRSWPGCSRSCGGWRCSIGPPPWSDAATGSTPSRSPSASRRLAGSRSWSATRSDCSGRRSASPSAPSPARSAAMPMSARRSSGTSARRSGLTVDPAATQVVSRDRHAELLTTLAILGGTLERMSVEVRHLQRTEVAEAFEPFGAGQQGSSAMPHKRNPILAERVSGLARLLRGDALVGLENMALWHERDISHSSAERFVFERALGVAAYATRTLATVLDGLEVDAERMRANLDMSGGMVYRRRCCWP